MTHTSANQHRIATEEVSKCAEENRAFHDFNLFSHKISVSDISDNMYCVQVLFVRSLDTARLRVQNIRDFCFEFLTYFSYRVFQCLVRSKMFNFLPIFLTGKENGGKMFKFLSTFLTTCFNTMFSSTFLTRQNFGGKVFNFLPTFLTVCFNAKKCSLQHFLPDKILEVRFSIYYQNFLPCVSMLGYRNVRFNITKVDSRDLQTSNISI